ncbi:Ubiquitin carboxyl-terminal hydrolase 45, partial [Podila epigama]
VSVGTSLKEQLLAQSKASSLNASFTTTDNSEPIPESEQGTEAHLNHVAKLLKNVGHVNTDKLSIERSLNQFTSVDYLEGDNKFACENCYSILKRLKKEAGSPNQDMQADMENAQDEVKEAAGKDDGSGSDAESDQERDGELSLASTPEAKQRNDAAAASESSKEPKHILRRAYKRYLISTLPPTLVLHLKRFEQTGLRSRKIEDQVEIPVELDMAPYVIPENELHEEEGGAAGHETHRRLNQVSSTKYRLYGAVVHAGTLASGHYTNYVLSSKVELASVAEKKDTPSTPSGVGAELPDIPMAMLAQMQGKGKKKGRGKKGGSGPQQQPQPVEPKSESQATEKAQVAAEEDTHWIHCSDLNVRMATLEEVLSSRPYLVFYERVLS